MPPFVDPSRSWPFVLTRGLMAVFFGLLALLAPQALLVWMLLLFSAYLLVDGGLTLLAGARAARAHEKWGWFLLEGLATLVAGVVAFVWPGITLLAFVAVLAAWALLSGGFMLMGAYRLQRRHGRGWMIAGGLLSMGWGIALLVWPAAGALILALWLGAYTLVFGAVQLVLALQLRREARVPLASRVPAG